MQEQEVDPEWFAWTMMGTISSCVIFDLLEAVKDRRVRSLCILELTDPCFSDLTPAVLDIIEEGDCYYSNLDVYRSIKTYNGH
jgi:hypothetical protein